MSVVVGTAGHIDHGKSTLIDAIEAAVKSVPPHHVGRSARRAGWGRPPGSQA